MFLRIGEYIYILSYPKHNVAPDIHRCCIFTYTSSQQKLNQYAKANLKMSEIVKHRTINSEKYVSISFQIVWNMIVVTVFTTKCIHFEVNV